MALVTKMRKRIEIPHEPGEWMEIQRLSFRQLEDARNVRASESRQAMQEMGGDIFRVIRDQSREELLGKTGVSEDELAAAQSDPLTFYDTLTLLRHGLRAWSYDDELNDKHRAALDEETATWAAREILRYSKPDLFEDDGEDEDPGNDATSSSSSSSIRTIGAATTVS